MVDNDYSRLCLMFTLLVDALWRVGECHVSSADFVVLKRFCVFS
jgi:hypothetical protein